MYVGRFDAAAQQSSLGLWNFVN